MTIHFGLHDVKASSTDQKPFVVCLTSMVNGDGPLLYLILFIVSIDTRGRKNIQMTNRRFRKHFVRNTRRWIEENCNDMKKVRPNKSLPSVNGLRRHCIHW